MRKLFPAEYGDLSLIPATGCSPTLMRFKDWMAVTPRWEQLTEQVWVHGCGMHEKGGGGGGHAGGTPRDGTLLGYVLASLCHQPPSPRLNPPWIRSGSSVGCLGLVVIADREGRGGEEVAGVGARNVRIQHRGGDDESQAGCQGGCNQLHAAFCCPPPPHPPWTGACLLVLRCAVLHLASSLLPQEPPLSLLMIQPPADHKMGPASLVGRLPACLPAPECPQLCTACLCAVPSSRPSCPRPVLPAPLHQMHYTWGPIFKDKAGKELWKFDKRDYTEPKHEQQVLLLLLRLCRSSLCRSARDPPPCSSPLPNLPDLPLCPTHPIPRRPPAAAAAQAQGAAGV